MKRIAGFAFAAFWAVPLCAQSVWLDRSRPDSVRAADLIARLTLEEKAGLMTNQAEGIERLGVRPYNWWNEALHGVARAGEATVYPMPIGMAASFDEELLYEVFSQTSDEGRVKHRLAGAQGDFGMYKGLTFWTPNINLFRDPRWGRGMETYGEDPWLTGRMGMAVVRGLQGPDSAGVRKAHACAKHLAVHSGPESERHRFDADVSDRDLYETYLPAFKDLVTKAGVREVMFAYNRFCGIPCGASERLLRDMLRKEWGFDGIVVSDCGAVDDFYADWGHHFVETPREAAAASVKAGANLECGTAFRTIPEAVGKGLLTEAEVDKALLPLLTERFRLGLFDEDTPWDTLPEEVLCSGEHAGTALKMARESIVLLKNDGILPLPPDAGIALVGPNAADSAMMWGNYNGTPLRTVTLLDALRRRKGDLVFEKGCAPVLDTLDGTAMKNLLEKLEGIGTVVFAGGISPSLEGEQLSVEVPGFKGGDRTSLELPEVQRNLIRALHEAGKKVILVNFSGSAMGLVPESGLCAAILQAWYPGQEGGTAVADVLYGDCNPSGKLPVTFYRSADQLPDFTDYAMRGRTYRYFTGEPLYPFGYGLSYTTFKFRRGRIRTLDGRKMLVVPVRNTGKRDGETVVQLYVRKDGDAEGPVKTLRGFRRVRIPAGKKRKVTIPLDDETFTWWSAEAGNMVPSHGRFTLMYGGSSAGSDLRTRKFRWR